MTITPADERYRHQRVAPALAVEHPEPAWQERCYHLLVLADGAMLNLGRSVWPVEGRRRGFLGFSDGQAQYARRVEAAFDPHSDDPDDPELEGLRVTVVEPLRQVELAYADPAHDLTCELTYRARFAPVATDPLRIEQQGRVVTDYLNFFQSGIFDGHVTFRGRRHEVQARAGFRDRGWGLRKHEGAPRRGLVLTAFCELEDEAFYLLLGETASGRRVMTNGWWLHAGGAEAVTEVTHDLVVEELLVTGGELGLRFPTRGEVRLGIHPLGRLFLAAVGYSPDPELTTPGVAVHDVRDPAVRRALQGQTDHGCRFEVDGGQGHGFVETGIGIHARYRPPAAAD